MRAVLRVGSRGYEVERLQDRLLVAGFPPGRIDGRFGPATEAALLGFQAGAGLLADGICGPLTWQALEPGLLIATDATRRIDVEIVARMFPFTPLDRIAANLPPILEALRAWRIVDKPLVLAALATVRAEAEEFAPVEERVSRFNTSPGGRPFDLYDHRRDLGNRGPDDGNRFRGRGFVQLTGRDNYVVFGDRIGIGRQLVDDPEEANALPVAAQLLGAFIASRAGPLKQAILRDDLDAARRLVNGGAHGLDRFADAFRHGDAALDDPVWRAHSARSTTVGTA